MTIAQSLARQRLAKRKRIRESARWPEQYTSSRTGKSYQPHNDQEAVFVLDDVPRYGLLKGGEGAGKSVAGVIKNLNRIRRGMDGIMVSPDLEHFKKSLWPVFKEWCPWQCVIDRHQYRKQPGWEPSKAFTMTFHNAQGGYTHLICGGAKETEIGSWEGPNVSFVHGDEMRRHKTAAALKVFDGRARIPGPNGEPPQIYFTTTPRKHWLFEYFGPLEDNDPHADFKADSFVATVLTLENEANLEPGFVAKRKQSLTEAEAMELLGAEWIDVSDIEKFVNIIWWDNCKEELPGLGRSDPMVLALDAAKGGETNIPDCFAVVGVTRHPSRKEDVAIRYSGIWMPPPGGLLDFEPIEEEIRRLCRDFSIIEVAYDPYQLHDMAMRLKKASVANFREFNQAKARLVADRGLQTLIMSKRIAHDGNPLLRQHIDNANIKKSGSREDIRIIKRATSLKVDAAVALSMATDRILYYNL